MILLWCIPIDDLFPHFFFGKESKAKIRNIALRERDRERERERERERDRETERQRER